MPDPHLLDADDAMGVIVSSWPGTSSIRATLDTGETKELEIAGVSYAAPPEEGTQISYDKGHIFVRCDSGYFIFQRLENVDGSPQRKGRPELRRVDYPAVFDQYTVLPPIGHETIAPIDTIEFVAFSARVNELEADTMLSRREAEVFVWRERGADRKQVSSLLGIAPSTVDEYTRRIKQKVETAFRTVDRLDAEIWECPRCGRRTIDPRTVVSDESSIYIDCPNCGEVGRREPDATTPAGPGLDD